MRVRVGNNTSVTLTLHTGAPQDWVLSHLQYSLFTHDCMVYDTVIKFADNTTVVGLIIKNTTMPLPPLEADKPCHNSDPEQRLPKSMRLLNTVVS